jgi:hypothetical protein
MAMGTGCPIPQMKLAPEQQPQDEKPHAAKSVINDANFAPSFNTKDWEHYENCLHQSIQ